MSSSRGRVYFATAACVVCHKVNGIGGSVAPPLHSVGDSNGNGIDVMAFVTRMWRGARSMVSLGQPVRRSHRPVAGGARRYHCVFARSGRAEEILDERYSGLHPGFHQGPRRRFAPLGFAFGDREVLTGEVNAVLYRRQPCPCRLDLGEPQFQAGTVGDLDIEAGPRI